VTSRDRVIAAIEHKPLDRVPTNYLGTPEIDARLREFFKLPTPPPRRPGEVVDYDWDIQRCLGTDLRVLRLAYKGPAIPTFEDGRVQNVFGIIRRPVRNAAGTYMEAWYQPYAGFQTVAEVEQCCWPDPSCYDFAGLVTQCRELRDYAIVYGWAGNVDLINGTAFGRGFERTILDIGTEDPVGLRLMEKRFEFWYEQTRLALEACHGAIDIVWMGDDFGTQRGLLFSPLRWRKVFRPRIQAMIDLSHRYNARLMLHSCGSTRILWPDFVEMGLDIYDTVQPEAAGMVPEELAREFGAHICLHGTISTQQTLPHGTAQDVSEQVRHRVESFGIHGGLILAPSHNIQPDTPLANIFAMYSAAGCFDAKSASLKQDGI
jgi:uroporphyrinogen decarboxylase